jgi:hypothetical protein
LSCRHWRRHWRCRLISKLGREREREDEEEGVKACENLEKLHKKMEWRLESEAGRWKMMDSVRGDRGEYVRSFSFARRGMEPWRRRRRRGLSFEIYMACG